MKKRSAAVVVGLPTRLDGSPNLQTPRVKKIVALLSQRLTIPVVTQDERLSSHEAEQRLAFGEKDWRRRKARLDAAAAAVILQDYLDPGQRRELGARARAEREEAERSARFCVLMALAVARRRRDSRACSTSARASRIKGYRTAQSSSSRSSRAAARARSVSGSSTQGSCETSVTFRAALWRTGRARSLQAGEFRFDRPMTPAEVIEKIARGDVYQPPHYVSRGADHPGDGAYLRGSRASAKRPRLSRPRAMSSAIRDIDPAAADLEGYLFPETYSLPRDTTAREARGADGGRASTAVQPARCSRRR